MRRRNFFAMPPGDGFNPRICKRCDPEHLPINKHGYVSIHASVKDATAAILNNRRFDLVSIHASVKDATLSMLDYGDLCSCFNPRICKRCDLSASLVWVRPKVSIHASVKDATGCCSSCWFNYLCFNPRICKRCDHRFCLYPSSKRRFNPRICKRCD